MAGKMKAAVVTAFDKPLSIEDGCDPGSRTNPDSHEGRCIRSRMEQETFDGRIVVTI